MPDPLPRVLFLCTGNSCRSQMAEGWARHLLAHAIDACSAGTNPHGLNPLAAQAKSDDEALPHYRRVRDEIRAFVETLPALLSRAGR